MPLKPAQNRPIQLPSVGHEQRLAIEVAQLLEAVEPRVHLCAEAQQQPQQLQILREERAEQAVPSSSRSSGVEATGTPVGKRPKT